VALHDDGAHDTDAIAELEQELREAARGRALFAASHPMPDPVECLRDPGELADYVASRLPLSPDVAQRLLEAANVELRRIQVPHALRRLSSILDAWAHPG
jgi:hypothetical protein